MKLSDKLKKDSSLRKLKMLKEERDYAFRARKAGAVHQSKKHYSSAGRRKNKVKYKGD